MSRIFLCLCGLGCVVLSGCGAEETKDPNSHSATANSGDSQSQPVKAPAEKTSGQKSGQTSPAPNETNEPIAKFDFKFKNGEGKSVYYLKFDGEDGKLLSGDKKEICRYKRSGAKFKIVEKEKTVGRIAGYSDRFKIEDGEGTELFEYQKSGTDWKMKKEEKMLLRVKELDYGFETETPNDQRFNKVKESDGKKSLRDADEKTILYTKDGMSAKAMVPLGFKQLDDRHRFGLALAVQIELGQ